MSITFTVFIAIDDATPRDQEPFTSDPSVWSLANDFGLLACSELQFFAALGFPHLKGYPPGRIAHKGVGSTVLPNEIRQWLQNEEYVGWLTGDEVFESLRQSALNEAHLGRPVRVLLEILRILSVEYGGERVRMIFSLLQ